MTECRRHPGNLASACLLCQTGIELPSEAVPLAELLLAAGFDADKPVMFRVRGEVFACTLASITFEKGRYVLMLDGETDGLRSYAGGRPAP